MWVGVSICVCVFITINLCLCEYAFQLYVCIGMITRQLMPSILSAIGHFYLLPKFIVSCSVLLSIYLWMSSSGYQHCAVFSTFPWFYFMICLILLFDNFFFFLFYKNRIFLIQYLFELCECEFSLLHPQ